ncbi:kinesin-like protein KIF20A [Danio aesculapii]|uniref:kinesin-like protein KIF20A n=1 Tax=Danio aesculapii TaxID=1142201 RepID=UPI0024BF87C8|nr:kinesin-like protein KIF20A [Danio aesculapii]XP_056302805.1 kinesin-like protein KIF20A [Danio aesculapii]XP_056302806.1 kinesin-like protein KIF20A [Danio aesculapii]
MALASPCGILSDEEECGAVFESTAADVVGLMRSQRFVSPLPEISVITPAADSLTPTKELVQIKSDISRRGSTDDGSDKLKVFLRIRPLTEAEKDRGEEQGCVNVQSEENLLLKAPKDSRNMKSAERGVAQSVHKFTFTKIFGPQTSQQEVYDHTIREMVRDVLRGENRLLYTYGVTNSGKTYTIQGAGAEAGLLPRALVSVFLKLSGRLYTAMDLKPVLSQEVRKLDVGEVRAEEMRRDALLKEDESTVGHQSRLRAGLSWDSGISGLSVTSHIATQLEDSDGVCLEANGLCLSGGEDLEEGVQFSVWVSFYEIYNEFLYDLLEAPPSLQCRKRVTLRLSDDKHGNPYVKDLTWIQVHSAEEAWKVLKVGQRNQSFASTHLNHNSSRSHSIFTIRVLHVKPQLGQVTRISELSVCDLAGSERCKAQQNGERMKEANNINTSLLTLGRCITALRHNQSNKSRPPVVVPFRDSKLTRVLQSFFCGHGRSCMVVNINPCASTYDETLQALKFSAIATQLVHGPCSKTRVAYILSLLREQPTHPNDTTLLEEDEEESDEEGDITMFDPEALLKAIDVLKREVLRQRQEKEELEAKVREEVCTEMMEVISRMQDDFSETLESERDLMEKRCENKINNLKSSLKKYYSQELEERDDEIRELTAALTEKVAGNTAPAAIFPPLNDDGGPRRSQRLASTHKRDAEHESIELIRCKAELEQCRAELDLKQTELRLKTLELKRFQDNLPSMGITGTLTTTAERKLEEGQRNLKQLRVELQMLGIKLQSGERACCRNTDGEKLRHALSSADSKLAKQDQMLVELHTSLQLVKAELRKKDHLLTHFQNTQQAQSHQPPMASGSCKKRGCGVAVALVENQPPEKRPFFRSLFPSRTAPKTPSRPTRQQNEVTTPYSRVLRSRQPSPPTTPIMLRVKY